MNRRRVSALAAVAAVVAGAIGFGEIGARGEGELPGQTFLVSSLSDGTPTELPFAVTEPSMSGDGRFLVWTGFVPCPGIVRRVAAAQFPCGVSLHLKDRESGTLDSLELDDLDGTNTTPVISRDGCSIAFATFRSFDPVNDDTDGADRDIYVLNRCRAGSPIQLVTRGGLTQGNSSLGQGPALSGDGRFVAFSFQPDPGGTSADIALVDRDSNGNGDLLDTAPSEQIVVNTSGTSPNPGAIEPALSADGSRLAFNSDYNPTSGAHVAAGSQIWVLDRPSGTFTAVSARGGVLGDLPSRQPAISGDGSVVAFASRAQNLSDVALPQCPELPFCAFRLYARDLGAEPELIALNESGAPSTRSDGRPALSFDGMLVAFEHFGSDLVAPPAPGVAEEADIILVNRATRRPTRISVNPSGGSTTLDNDGTAINNNGRFVGFLAGEAQEVLGVALNEENQVLVRDRAAQLSVSGLDFGAVTVGGLPEIRTATVTNNHGATFEIGAIGTSLGEFAVGGGTCAPGTRLAPTQSCTIDVAFTPGGEGPRAETLTVSSAGGFDANPPGSGPLNASGQLPATTAPPVDTTAAPTTTTTGTTAPQSTTTAPSAVNSLTISPTQATFPATPLAVISVAQAFTIRNTGNRPNAVTAATLIGANPGDYLVTSDACAGANLAPNATCLIGVAFRPTATGARPASVRVDGTGGSSASATLAGDGASAPTLVFSPAVAKGGTVTIAIGGGFPANSLLTLTFDGQGGPLSVTTDAIGAFRLSIVVRGGERPGTLTLAVNGVPGQFDTVTAPLLVVLGTYQPQSGTGPAFGNSSILARG